MITINEDFFSNSGVFSNLLSTSIPLEVKNSRYGYSPRLNEFRYENIYSGSELKVVIDSHKYSFHTRKNPRSVEKNKIGSNQLGFGPISTDGFYYETTIQYLPLYIIEHFLKVKENLTLKPLIYKQILKEYNIRHDLNEKYLRPLEIFHISKDFFDVSIEEEYYNPLSIKSYSRHLDRFSEDSKRILGSLGLLIYRESFRSLPLRELHRILLYLNMSYINSDNSIIEKYPKVSNDTPLTSTLISAPVHVWILAIFNELEIRACEYKILIEKPENVLFTI